MFQSLNWCKCAQCQDLILVEFLKTIKGRLLSDTKRRVDELLEKTRNVWQWNKIFCKVITITCFHKFSYLLVLLAAFSVLIMLSSIYNRQIAKQNV